MSSNTQTGSPDAAAMLQEIFEATNEYILESVHDFQDYIARPRVRHWLRIIAIVGGYIMVRPLIELFFRKLFESKNRREEEELRKKREEEDAQLEAEGLKKPSKDANSLRVGRGTAAGANAGAAGDSAANEQKEPESGSNKNKGGKNHNNAAANKNTKDEYENSDQEDFAEKIRASGVLEWGRDARKRQKNSAVKVAEAGRNVEQMEEEKLMELLDWSEDEDGVQRVPKPQK